MKRITILCLMMVLLFVSMVSAWDMCEEKVEVTSNCTMVTPVVIDCTSFSYDILNLSGSTVSSGDLANLSGNIYYFNFTESEGDYIVKLCDGTTREVRVTSEDTGKMVIAIIILLPILLGLFMLIGAATLSDDHVPLRIVLFLLSIPSFWISMHFGMLSLVEFYGFTALQDSMGDVTFWTAVIFFTIVSYFIIYAIYKVFENMAEKKKERLRY